jgi:hypothetical protein
VNGTTTPWSTELAGTFDGELGAEISLTVAIDMMEGGMRDLQDVIEATTKAA